MIKCLTDPFICVSTGISLSLLWITSYDVYKQYRHKYFSPTSVRPSLQKITLKTLLNPAFFIGYGIGIIYCFYDKTPLAYIMFPHRFK